VKAGGGRREADGRWREADGRRQVADGGRQTAGGRWQKAEGRRQKAEGRRQKRRREFAPEGRDVYGLAGRFFTPELRRSATVFACLGEGSAAVFRS
jgi:hypothetical protein